MARRRQNKKTNANKNEQKPRQTKYQKEGFLFSFSDEDLQDLYINWYKHFSNTITLSNPEMFPKPRSVSKNMAKTLVNASGKQRRELEQIESIVNSNTTSTDRDSKAGQHISNLYEQVLKLSSGSTSIPKLIKNFNKMFDKIQELTGEDPRQDAQASYNVLYYMIKKGYANSPI